MTARDTPLRDFTPTRIYARRALARLDGATPWVRSKLDRLLDEISSALASRNVSALGRLASGTDFAVATGCGEMGLVETRDAIEMLANALARSTVRLDPDVLDARDGKYYVATDGWLDAYFIGRLYLIVTETAAGWEWTGVMTPWPTPAWKSLYERIMGPAEVGTNQPLPNDFPIRAPWPRPSTATVGVFGLGEPGYMRAGGLWTFEGFMMLAVMALFTGADAALVLAEVFTPPELRAVLLALLAIRVVALFLMPFLMAQPCGWCFPTLFYNNAPTHLPPGPGWTTHSAFAIDFNRGVPNVVPVFPVANVNIRRTPALAAQGGYVIFADFPVFVGGVRTSPAAPTAGNVVIIAHLRAVFDSPVIGGYSRGSAPGAVVVSPGTSSLGRRGPFSSRYMHFANPGTFISRGMGVYQGAPLGEINNTGNSLVDHLHFELHDASLGVGASGDQIPLVLPAMIPGLRSFDMGPSLRPDPMDGHRMWNQANGDCILSTNGS